MLRSISSIGIFDSYYTLSVFSYICIRGLGIAPSPGEVGNYPIKSLSCWLTLDFKLLPFKWLGQESWIRNAKRSGKDRRSGQRDLANVIIFGEKSLMKVYTTNSPLRGGSQTCGLELGGYTPRSGSFTTQFSKISVPRNCEGLFIASFPAYSQILQRPIC
jgi:hypothetical protein